MTKDETVRSGALTRRAAFACGAGAAMLVPALAKPLGAIVSALAIHQEEFVTAPPARIYQLLLDAKQFAAMTGRKAEIDPVVGGKFSLFDGVIFGRNVEEIHDTRLVQAWSDTGWTAGVYSVVRFELKRQAAGTLIVFDHTGFPNDPREAAHLVQGWNDHYWNPMRAYFKANP